MSKTKTIKFEHALGITTLNGEVATWSYERIKETYEGILDYVGLAKQLGIEPKKSAPKGNDQAGSNAGTGEKK